MLLGDNILLVIQKLFYNLVMQKKMVVALKEIVRVTVLAIRNFRDHGDAVRAAALAFYGVLSIFPLLLFLVFIGATVLASDTAQDTVIGYLDYVLPVSADNIESVIHYTLVRRGSIGLIAGVGLLWSGSSVFGVLLKTLNAIWGGAARPYWQRRVLAALFVLVLGIVFAALFYLAPILGFVIKSFGIGNSQFVVPIVEFLFAVIVCYLLFRVFPNCSVSRSFALIGALVSGGLFEIVKLIFSAYINLAIVKYGYVYGSIAWVVALGWWLYLEGIVFFFGAEVGAALDKEAGNLA